jgi:hypothetical protein
MFTLKYQNALIAGYFASKQVEVIDKQAKCHGTFDTIAAAEKYIRTKLRGK